jgi:imidazolonepropionase-like amidohydrolase
MRYFATLLVCLLPLSALADTVFLTAGRLIDPVAEKPLEDVALLIENGIIVARGAAGRLEAPAGATHIDLGTMTVLPGFIDMHTHLTGSATKGRGYSGLGLSRHRGTIWGVVNAAKTLAAGFTAVRDVGAEDFIDVALRDAINEGEIPGPRMFVSGPPVGIRGGHCSDNNLLPPENEAVGTNVAAGPWEMRDRVRRNIKFGVDLIKTCSTGGVFSKGTRLGAAQTTREELEAIVDEAHMRGLRVASHAHGTQGIKNAIEAGVDTIDHSSYLDDDAIEMGKARGVYFVPDIYNTEFTLAQGLELGILEESLEKERQVSQAQRDSFRRAVEAGAMVVFGSDAGVYPHGDNPKQFARMVQFGMTPMQAIVAATSLAAEALGQPALGCLDVDCAADIVAVSGDPLAEISLLEQVQFVMKAGTVYKDETGASR